MPTSDPPGKKSNGKAGMIAAIAALITALTPLYIGLLDDTVKKQAERSDQKAELGYELLTQRMASMDERITVLGEDMRELQRFLRDVLMKHAEVVKEVERHASRPTSSGPRRTGGAVSTGMAEEREDIKDIASRLDEKIMGDDATMIRVEQRALPQSLEEGLKKKGL